MDSACSFVWALLSIAPFKDGGVFLLSAALRYRPAAPRRCAAVFGQRPKRTRHPALGAALFAQGGTRRPSGFSQGTTQIPPLGFISRKGNFRSWNPAGSGRRTWARRRLGQVRPGERTVSGLSPGWPKPPYPSSVPLVPRRPVGGRRRCPVRRGSRLDSSPDRALAAAT